MTLLGGFITGFVVLCVCFAVWVHTMPPIEDEPAVGDDWWDRP